MRGCPRRARSPPTTAATSTSTWARCTRRTLGARASSSPPSSSPHERDSARRDLGAFAEGALRPHVLGRRLATGARLVDRALGAVGRLRGAEVAPVELEPERDLPPLRVREQRAQRLLHVLRVLVLAQP